MSASSSSTSPSEDGTIDRQAAVEPSAAAALRRYVLLVALRWLPTGLMVPVTVLLAQDRGLSLSQIGIVIAVQGFVVFGAELPLGALADALGRRQALLMSGAVAIAALVLIAVADTVIDFAIAMAVQGLWRALDSGPLEAWYVDTARAADADADITSGLGAGATAQNLAMAAGALASGAIVALGRAAHGPALVLPVLVAVAMTALGTLAVAALVRENRPVDTGTRRTRWTSALAQTPAVMREVVGLLRSSRVLLALIAVELFWGFGMVSFETFMPPRLGEVLGSPERAGVWMGPITSAGWVAAAIGAALAPLLSRRIGLAPVAAGTRILQGATVVGIGLFTGPVGVVTAYVACYAVHGASNPVHNALLHLQAGSGNRAAVLSLNSMVGQPAFAVGSLVLGALADQASISAAMVAAAVALALAAPLYLPAWHQGRERTRARS